MRYYLSLGSNLGNRKKNLALASSLLAEGGIEIVRASSIYRTQPVDYADQPWFYNQVLEVNTALDPLTLLKQLKSIEIRMKRLPAVDKGPRTIDIDILLAGKTVIQTRKLMIPHPRMCLRNFVLVPLDEIAPDAVHPLLHERIEELMSRTGDPSVVRKLASPREPKHRRAASAEASRAGDAVTPPPAH
ncbi:MAG: 2-amino-4-hydroxy-6-hydroxymethyldihydropteridine diphosphokinase [Candidatus Aminicenantales bacterium]